MYLPPHFAETRTAELHRIIGEHPLGILVTGNAGALDANHVPFEFDAARGPHGTLTAHVARANPIWKDTPSGTEVLVIFRGVEGYISPSWYPSKHEAHRQVPTWNYEVVHAHGRFTAHDDERYVRGVVARLTRAHEAGEPVPWKMGDAPPDYIASMLANIIGIEVEITRLVGKAKLGQNKELRDREGAVDALRERGRTPLSEAMKDTLPGQRRG